MNILRYPISPKICCPWAGKEEHQFSSASLPFTPICFHQHVSSPHHLGHMCFVSSISFLLCLFSKLLILFLLSGTLCSTQWFICFLCFVSQRDAYSPSIFNRTIYRYFSLFLTFVLLQFNLCSSAECILSQKERLEMFNRLLPGFQVNRD